MTRKPNPIRLFVEILGTIALVDVAVVLVLTALAPQKSVATGALLNACLLVLLAGPAIYWRCMAVTNRTAAASRAGRAAAVPSSGSVRTAVAMTAAAQLIGVAVTAASVVWVRGNLEADARFKFELHVERILADVQRRFRQPVYGLRGVAGLYAANRTVPRSGFRAYVQSKDLLAEFPGVLGFGFIQRVMRDELDEFVAAERADEAPEFDVRGAGRAKDLYVIKLIEPLSPNRPAWGLDLGAEPVRRAAVEQALRSGEPTLSGRITLVQDGAKGAGFIYVLPVYRSASAAQTPAQREAALLGFTYCPVVAAQLLDGAVDAADGLVGFSLVDGSVAGAGSVLFDAAPGAASGVGAEDRFTSSRRVVIGGRELTLHARSTPAFEATVDRSKPVVIAFCGAGLSFLLALTVWLLAVGRVRAQNKAQRMTADLDRLAKVVQRTSNAVVITDRELRITWVNQGFTNISGYSLEEAVGLTAGALLSSPDADPATLRKLTQSAASGESCRVEVLNRSKDGREYWIDTEVQPTRDERGVVTGFMEIGSDVTEQKNTKARLEAAARELARERERLSAILTGTNVGTWEWNVQSGETLINARAAEMLGHAPGALSPLAAATWQGWVHAEDWMRAARKLQRHLRRDSDYFDSEMRLRRVDGGWVWVLVRGRVSSWTEDGRPLWMAGTQQDISQRKRGEAALRDQLHFTQQLMETIPIPVQFKDLEGRFLGLNRAAEQMLKVKREDWIGKTLAQVYPAELAQMHGAIERELIEQAGGRTYEGVTRASDGTLTQVRISKTLFTRADGAFAGTIAAMVDIGDFKKAQQALREGKEAADSANRAKSQFLANMSHEIRTPMNAILGMLRLLQNTPLTPRQLDYAGKTEAAARSLLGLLNDILDFSKIEAGKMTLDLRPFHLDGLLRDLSVILAANVGPKDLEVLFDIDPSVPAVLHGDDMRLQQVLINLGGNAIKFTAQGEVVVGIHVRERRGDAVLLRFAVRDTGIGIAPQNQTHIFSGFSQAEGSTTRRFGGTGLGLAICQRLVGMMGGELRLDSALGAGSTFHFDAWLALGEASSNAPAPPRRCPASLRALIVDDNPSARFVLAAMARSIGWQVEVAAGGDEAIALIEKSIADEARFEAILIDWQMPGLDGWETSLRIRRLAGPAQAPLLVMVTAHGREMLARRSADEQSLLDGFLVKPVTASMLFDAIEEARGAMRQRVAAPLRGQGRLTGMRLLVVEDNPNNQQVAQELLADEGAQVELAGNGREGVAAVEAAAAPFHAVLMDIQMPVMDGYAATAEIRQRLGLDSLPIIAMTANAMASDREACLAAGMNDHVGKPFDLHHLVATLQRHVALLPPTPWKRPQPASDLPAVLLHEAEHAGVELQAALGRFGGNAALYARTLQRFVDDAISTTGQLPAQLRRGEPIEAGRLMHSLKGLAATLGASRLAALAAAAETALASGEAPRRTDALLEAWRNALDAAAPAMKRLGDRLEGASPAGAGATVGPPPDAVSLGRSLDELQRLLRDADMRAVDVHARLPRDHAALPHEALQPLDAAMAALDFDRALAHCEALRQGLQQ
jgi:PAS domain S-box-containing protein